MTDHIKELRKRGMITSLAKVPSAKTNNIEVLRGLVAKWRDRDGVGSIVRFDARLRCAAELDAALAAMGGQGETVDEARQDGYELGLMAAPQQPEARVGGEVDVTGFGTPPLMHDERADAEKAYSLTAFDYSAAPIGSRDWTIYWRGWWHRSLVYTSAPPPSAVPEDK